MELIIDNQQNEIKLDKNIYELVEEAIRESLILERGSTDYEISIVFVNNAVIKSLNKKYRNIDEVTDVLSFPLGDDMFFAPVQMLGDIIISVEMALKQSKDYGHSFIREILYLTVHSMLHLLGYDHINESDRVIMRAKEKEIMMRLGIFKKGREEL